ncbi:hypothetical protein [Pelagibacterium luteolum]|uniref:DUF2834 domain-containing protein n=1 Tax=Pelagibacterium luteolum TaxID=440168 RepID=A0A1G7XHP9_9HYPH|nr:hypothetical protein [Pelagibacterium luteolum]SDG83654.1 hypothetical protein SAMN04487974_109119 [Pelagibacterium luteolum]
MTLIRVALIVAAVAFAAMIVSAALRADIFESFAAVSADPWGAVSLVDLYIGFLAFGVIVWFVEPDMRARLGVIIALPFLGNLVALPWLAWRLPMFARALRRR